MIEMAVKTAKKACKSSLSEAGQVVASNESDLRAERMQVTLPQLNNKDAERIKADNSLLDLADGKGLIGNIVSGNLIETAVERKLWLLAPITKFRTGALEVTKSWCVS